jgi:divalent metal cation (Fe/Co/Zn/Cd) transporter
VHVLVDGAQSLRQAHDLTEEVERSIQSLVPNADVTVHAEPNDDVPDIIAVQIRGLTERRIAEIADR